MCVFFLFGASALAFAFSLAGLVIAAVLLALLPGLLASLID
jgi:hypothetical protein